MLFKKHTCYSNLALRVSVFALIAGLALVLSLAKFGGVSEANSGTDKNTKPVDANSFGAGGTAPKIYVANCGTNCGGTPSGEGVTTANLDGTGGVRLPGFTGLLNGPQNIAFNTAAGKMYVTNELVTPGTVTQSNLDGSNAVNLTLGNMLDGAYGIALDVPGNTMYVASVFNNKVVKANLDGTNPVDLGNLGGLLNNFPQGLAINVAGNKMYIAHQGGNNIVQANLDGTGGTSMTLGGLAQTPLDIALDVPGNAMYVAVAGGTVIKAQLDGTNAVDLGIPGLSFCRGITLDPVGGKMYITSQDTNKVTQADMPNGANPVDLNIATLNSPNGITILRPPAAPAGATRFDLDGDRKTDIGIFRPAPAEWWYLRSSDNAVPAFQFGSTTDIIAPADFTGDGRTDVAFFRPGTGEWYVLRSEDSTFFAFPFGTNGDIPAPGDFDGDGRADPAVFRPAIATWFINNSGGGISTVPFGANGDRPIVEDYDGDGRDDIAVFRPGAAEWYLNRSTDGFIGFQFGAPGNTTPVVGDYTGDNKADVAFFRPSDSQWFVLRSEDSSFFAFPFGTTGDLPAPGDYDGDGRTDSAVFRPSTNTWFLNQSTNGNAAVAFGITGDVPIPSAYIP